MKKAVIIDTDPGIDDAVAIVTGLFAPNLDIKLICTNAGNLGISTTTKNALHLLELYDFNIPVAQGGTKPLGKTIKMAKYAHGANGLGTYAYENVNSKPLKMPAYEAMHLTLQLYNDVTILALGPLTNVALLLKHYPKDAKRIEKVVFMGGTKEDVMLEPQPYPEFNVARDPEAVEFVINSKVNLHIIPMDFGHNAFITPTEIEKLKKINETGKFFAKLYEEYHDRHVERGSAATHDSCAIAYLIEPTLFKVENVDATVKYFNDKGIIATKIVNRNSRIKLAVDMNIEGFKNLYFGLVNISKMKSER